MGFCLGLRARFANPPRFLVCHDSLECLQVKVLSGQEPVGPVARGAVQRGDPLHRSLPTMASTGCLREHAGRNESEPMCSVVREPTQTGGWLGSVEPLRNWRRLVCSAEGQEFCTTAGGIRPPEEAHFYPRVCEMRAEQLPGVAGMACMESIQVNRGRSEYGPQSRRGNLPLGEERRTQKSEQLIVVMTAGTTQPCMSEGAVRMQHLFWKLTADTVPKGGITCR